MTHATANRNKSEEQIRREIPTEKVTSAFIKAGAGAGKTSLLVERIYQQLVRGVEPSRIAAITFTNKAANEMYDRISKKLQEKEAELEPGKDREIITKARRQMEEMQISTIHSFCRKVVEEFPFFAGLSLDMLELDDAEVIALQKKLLNQFLLSCMSREDELDTETLWHCNEQFTANMRAVKEKMGRALSEQVCKNYIYDLSKLNSLKGLGGIRLEALLSQRENGKLQDIAYAKAVDEAAQIRQDAIKWLEGIFADFQSELQTIIENPDTEPATREKLKKALDGVKNNDAEGIKTVLKKGKQTGDLAQLWCERDKTETAEEILFRSYVHKLSEWMDTFIKDTKELKPLQNWWDGNCQSYQGELGCLKERYEALRRRVLFAWCKEFRDYYLDYEKQNKVVGNHNVVYRALQIVSGDEAVARKISERFDTIYIDEYQDTDAQQAELFQKLWEASKGKLHLFYIGDAKQSIYAFRGADPAQFKKQEEIFEAAEAAGTDDRRVLELHFNYRSNAAVCEWVNHEFQTDYQGEEMVSKSLSQKCSDRQLYGVYHFPVVQIEPDVRTQAEAVARLIADLIGRGACIWDVEKRAEGASDGLRPVRASDFLLLFWKTKNMEVFQDALRAEGLSVQMDGRVHFAGNRAYQALVAILEYCDHATKYHKYQALTLCPSMTVTELEDLRESSGRMLPAAFVRSLLTDDRLFDYVWGGKEEALAGLYHAIEEAAQSRYTDLGEFLKLLPKDKENDHTLSLAQREGDCIRLMNIHRAKGLEGQIVICCEAHEASKFGGEKQDEEQYRNLEYVMYTRAREALIFAGDSFPVDSMGSAESADGNTAGGNSGGDGSAEGNTAEDSAVEDASAEGNSTEADPAEDSSRKLWELLERLGTDTQSQRDTDVVLNTDEMQEASQDENAIARGREEKKKPKVRHVNPSLEKRKMQAQQTDIEREENVAEEDEAENIEQKAYVERPYGKRLGLIVHRVMELAVNEGAKLCPLAEKAEKDAEKSMPEEMRKIVEPLLRFAVAEELIEPLTKREREQLQLREQDDASEDGKALFEQVCDAVRGYVFAFLYAAYLQPRYRHCIQDCEVYTELPFFVHDEGSDGGEEVVHGIMDLVVKEKSGDGTERYIVADYKTNCQYMNETQKEYEARLHEKYDQQLGLYKEILRKLFKLPEETSVDTWIISYYME